MINFTSKPRYMLDDLIRLVHALRAPGGCPWAPVYPPEFP